MHKSEMDNDNRMWRKYGFYIHLEKDKGISNKVNYHTHGILHSRGKADFLITQPLDPILAKTIFIELVDSLDQGFVIKEGTIIGGLIEGVTLEFRNLVDKEMVLHVVISGGSNINMI